MCASYRVRLSGEREETLTVGSGERGETLEGMVPARIARMVSVVSNSTRFDVM